MKTTKHNVAPPGINYLENGSGFSVTLIHGVGADLTSWNNVTERLVHDFRVIRLDLRGHGNSNRITQSYSLNAFVDDVLAVLNERNILRTDLVGFSLGGMIAQLFALTYPERVRNLALISAVAGRTPEERQRLRERAKIVRENGVESVMHAAEERWFTDDFRKKHPEKVEKRLKDLLNNDPSSYAEAYRVFAESDVGDRIHEIPHRTLVVTGENDVGSNPRMARFMHDRIVNSQLVILPELKHSLLVEAPDTVADLLLQFFRSGNDAAR